MNSYVEMTMVKKNRDKMVISVNKAYFIQASHLKEIYDIYDIYDRRYIYMIYNIWGVYSCD